MGTDKVKLESIKEVSTEELLAQIEDLKNQCDILKNQNRNLVAAVEQLKNLIIAKDIELFNNRAAGQPKK